MKLAGIDGKVSRGFALAAARLGYGLAQYRPVAASRPVSGVPLSVVTGYFDPTKGLSYREAAAWGKPVVELVASSSGLAVGDYLVVQADPALPTLSVETAFVSRIEPARPMLAVLCNAVLDLLASGSTARQSAIGYQPPADPAAATDIVLASGWPASVLVKTRSGEAPPARLPTDVRSASYEVLMPLVPGVAVTAGLRARDASGQHYHLVAVERSAYGLHMLASIDQA